ncbi:hypothetical protein APHAL10511_004815 [Amanita phalloides]|nr:hypothetical protein APHAL10511_004815 [Amanita phalloides]
MAYCIVQRSRPKFVTYQFADKRVFVAPAPDYEAALDIAQKEFPKLATIPRDRILFNVYVYEREKKARGTIRISSAVWAATMDNASPGQIISIEILPPPRKIWSPFRRAKSVEPGVRDRVTVHLAPGDASADSKSWSESSQGKAEDAKSIQ